MNIKDLIEVNPQKMRGTPVFKGTRVPIAYLFEYLEKGETGPSPIPERDSLTNKQPEYSNSQRNRSSRIMKLLLDECVVRDLKRDLVGHDVSTTVEAGFGGLENGDLLLAAAGNYDVLIRSSQKTIDLTRTVDQNLQYQPNISSLPIPLLVIIGSGITHRDLQPLIPKVLEALARSQSGQIEILTH